KVRGHLTVRPIGRFGCCAGEGPLPFNMSGRRRLRRPGWQPCGGMRCTGRRHPLTHRGGLSQGRVRGPPLPCCTAARRAQVRVRTMRGGCTVGGAESWRMVLTKAKSDPIALELFKNAIFSIADEMALTVFRTTYSAVLKDNMD